LWPYKTEEQEIANSFKKTKKKEKKRKEKKSCINKIEKKREIQTSWKFAAPFHSFERPSSSFVHS
jgi:hypothetical protein